MKLDRPLSPPLAHIERTLFGVSEMLIEAVKRGETSSAISDAVRRSPEWAERHAEARVGTDELCSEVPAMPAHLHNLIQRRLGARVAMAHQTDPIPTAGQIIELRQIRTPKAGQLDWIMQVPLYVLLDAPAEQEGVWHGWLVSSEADYACWWDFVLQEEDGPCEPEAALVQLWNPLRVYLPMAERIVGRLAPSRLQAVRALAAEYVTSDAPADLPVWPGRVAQRTTLGGLSVVTGSRLGGEGDPRHQYQHLYFHAAEAVREPARLALAEAALAMGSIYMMPSWLQGIASRFRDVLSLAPRVELAMSESRDNTDLLWDGLARVSVRELASDGAGRAQVTAESDLAVTCELCVSGVLEFKQTIRRGESPVLVDWEAGESATLKLFVADGRRVEIPLVDKD